MNDDDWNKIKFFTPAEFDSPGEPGTGRLMERDFVALLDRLREKCGFPLHVNSGYRTPEHNAAVPGSVDGSAHTRGWAADIALSGRSSGEITWKRAMIVFGANLLGIARIGIGETFVHLDNDPALPTPRIWTYSKG